MSGSVDYVQTLQHGVRIVLGIAIGFVTCKWNLLPKSSIPPMNRFLLRMCYMSIMARSIWTRDVYNMSFFPFAVGVLTTLSIAIVLSLTTFASKKCLKCDWLWLDLGIFLPACYVNYIIFGLPIFNSMWSEEESLVLVVMNLHGALCTVPVYMILVNIYRVRVANAKHREEEDGAVEKFSPRLFLTILIEIVTNVFTIGELLGFAWALTRWAPCPFLDDLTKYLGDAALALTLFTVGGFLSQHSLMACNVFHFLVSIVLRMIVFPMVVGIYAFAFGLAPRLSKQCIICACLPTATTAFLITCEHNTGPGIASTVILWSTVMTVPVIIAWLYALEKLHIFDE